MDKDFNIYKCRCIVKGLCLGEAIVLKDLMCFYFCDPKIGIVIERNYAIHGKSIAGKILVLKSGKGSSVVQVDGFYQLKAQDTLPAAIIIRDTEPVIVSAAVVTGTTMVDRMDTDPFEAICDGDYVEVDADAEEVRVRKSK